MYRTTKYIQYCFILIVAGEDIAYYCKYCGGTNIRFGQQTNDLSEEKIFEPKVHVGVGSITMGGSYGLGFKTQ